MIFIIMERKIYIYGLYDIKDKKIRYVGKSVNVEKRLRGHLNESNRVKNHKNDWVRSVLKNNSKINFSILEVCNEENWKERERYWVITLRKENDLVNHTDGGDGEQTNRFNLSYNELKEWVKKNKPNFVDSISTYNKWVKNNDIPSFLPKSPKNVYEKYGWVSWGDFLDTNRESSIKMCLKYTTYDECKKWIKLNLQISNIKEWKYYYTNNVLPIFIPKKPDRVYIKKGWIDWYDFLGIDKKKFLTHDESKEWVKQTFGKLNVNDFKLLCKNNKIPKFIPKKPYNTYKEFISWYDWLGGKSKRNKKDYISFNVAKDVVRMYNIKTNKEWRGFIKEKTYELKIPTNPDQVYYDEWISWYDWLGK